MIDKDAFMGLVAIIFIIGFVAVVIIVVAYLVGLGLKLAWGQDADPRYYCIEKFKTPYPYIELCREQVMNEVKQYTDGLK